MVVDCSSSYYPSCRNPPTALHPTYGCHAALDFLITLHAKTPLIIGYYCIFKQQFLNNSWGRKSWLVTTSSLLRRNSSSKYGNVHLCVLVYIVGLRPMLLPIWLNLALWGIHVGLQGPASQWQWRSEDIRCLSELMSGPKSALENDYSGCGPAVALQDAGFSAGWATI